MQAQQTKSIRILGCRVDLLTLEEIESYCSVGFEASNPFHIITSNALMLMECRRQTALKKILEEAQLVTMESFGVAWATRFLTHKSPERIAGIDLAFHLCQIAAQKKRSVFLLGGKPGIAEAAAAKLTTQVPGLEISGTQDGFFQNSENDKILELIKSSQAKLVLVALGMPQQEYWIYNNRSKLSPAVYIGVGGSFDVWAGQLKRAPRPLQEWGLEWLYRLIQEPFRLGRMMKLPLFAILVIFDSIFRPKIHQ